MRYIYLVILFAFLISCQTSQNPQTVVNLALQHSGLDKMENATASFTFRDIQYQYAMKDGAFSYSRLQHDSSGFEIKDILTNTGLVRMKNDSVITITPEKQTAYSSSINSVIYFAFLPFSLNNEAVIKSYIGQVDILGKSYYKIKITFQEEGGGEDFEDIFFYWFDTEDYSMDYLAYSYNEPEGKGIRFREAFNSRKVEGITIQDYRNYKPIELKNFQLEKIDEAFVQKNLDLLSVIELEEVTIEF